MNSVAIAPAFIHASVKRRKNTWYSIADGNWTNPNIWLSNEIKRWSYPGQNITTPVFPQIGDDVYINHTVTLNTSCTINNLYVSGTFKADNSFRVINVNGDAQTTGTIDFTSSNVNLVLYGLNNYIVNFISGTSSTVTYARSNGNDQYILDLSYRNLAVSGLGTKYQTSNLIIPGTFIMNTALIFAPNSLIYELGAYNLTVNGNTTMNRSTTLSKTGSGSILFIGLFSLIASQQLFNLPGNPTVEFRNGINTSLNPLDLTSTTGLVSFTTNNQSIAGLTSMYCNTVSITGAITLTISAGNLLQINTSINGSVAGSALLNKGTLYLNTSTAPMITGSFDKDTFANTVGYILNASFTVPYTTYSSLYINGTGTKTLIGTTVLTGALSVVSGTLELSTYDLTVTGTTNLNNGSLLKSGAGNILFIGSVLTQAATVIDLSGNPTVEIRGGFTFSGTLTSSGTGVWTFSTNNQTFSIGAASIDAPIIISGAITLTVPAAQGFTTTNSINGNNAASTLDNRGTVNYKNATRPMITGVLQTNAAANTWLYNGATAQDITGGTYRTLTLAGGAFVKTLQGNVVVATLYTLTAPTTLNLNGFTRT